MHAYRPQSQVGKGEMPWPMALDQEPQPQRVFKTCQVSFSHCSLTLLITGERCHETNEVLRSYSRFSQAADENGLLGILVGFHFRKAVEEGIKRGCKLGKHAVEHFLKPMN
jgi:hypothetical protein